MIKIACEVTVYEIDGKETSMIPPVTITVRSHWNRDSLVVLEVDNRKMAVSAADLHAAITNATRTK
ncbi:MAG TPA: hypothetical protein VG994_02600 [Steroidobacteraceae bacterium]|nr:hypothetical protein [Steroidobacteraceae bacterium]